MYRMGRSKISDRGCWVGFFLRGRERAGIQYDGIPGVQGGGHGVGCKDDRLL